MMVSIRNVLSRLSLAALLDWKSSNSHDPSTTNVRRHVTVDGHYLVLNSRRRGSQSQEPPPLVVRGILLRMHHNFDVDTLKSWKYHNNMLNNRPPFVAIVDNNNIHKNCNADFQIRILKLSCSNFAK